MGGGAWGGPVRGKKTLTPLPSRHKRKLIQFSIQNVPLSEYNASTKFKFQKLQQKKWKNIWFFIDSISNERFPSYTGSFTIP